MFTDGSEKRLKVNKIISIATGVMIALGIWVFTDGIIQSYSTNHVQFYEFAAPICVLVGFFLLNNLPPDMFDRKGFWNEEAQCYQKLILVTAVILLFGSLVASIWIFLGVPLFSGDAVPRIVKWRGITSIIQTGITLVATLLWRFAWKDPESY